MKKVLTAFATALLLLATHSYAQQKHERNLAYEMSFVWQLADMLGNVHVMMLKALDPTMSSEFENDAKQQFSIVHFHLLIECRGPLRSLASQLTNAKYEPNKEGQAPNFHSKDFLATSEISVIINNWHRANMPRIMSMFQSGKYGFHPPCIEPEFVKQNPSVAAGK